MEARDEDLLDDTGLRGLIPPYGAVNDFAWYRVAANFGEGVKTRQMTPVQPGEGLEFYVPWETLYPGRSGGVPNSATLGIAVVLVNDDGGFTSNQALPSFPATTANPGRTAVALPGVVTFAVDANGDGVGDGASTPIALP